MLFNITGDNRTLDNKRKDSIGSLNSLEEAIWIFCSEINSNETVNGISYEGKKKQNSPKVY